MAVRITQAGVGLIIGIIILGLVVLGGLYLAKERGEQARRDTAIQIASENLESSSSKTGKTETLTPSDEGSKPNTAATTLPQTGPSEALMSFIAIGLLTFAAVSYHKSRRLLSYR